MITAPNDFATGVPVTLMTPAELALRWRMSTRTLDRWRRERYGPPWITLGGRILYRLKDVDAYEARHRRSGP